MSESLSVADRVARLEPFRQGAPKYRRSVADAADQALAYRSRTDASAEQLAEHYILLAELRADIITWEQFAERDPETKG